MRFLLLFFLLCCFFFVIDFVKHLFVAKSHLWAHSFFSHLWVTAKKKKKTKKYSGGILRSCSFLFFQEGFCELE